MRRILFLLFILVFIWGGTASAQLQIRKTIQTGPQPQIQEEEEEEEEEEQPPVAGRKLIGGTLKQADGPKVLDDSKQKEEEERRRREAEEKRKREEAARKKAEMEAAARKKVEMEEQRLADEKRREEERRRQEEEDRRSREAKGFSGGTIFPGGGSDNQKKKKHDYRQFKPTDQGGKDDEKDDGPTFYGKPKDDGSKFHGQFDQYQYVDPDKVGSDDDKGDDDGTATFRPDDNYQYVDPDKLGGDDHEEDEGEPEGEDDVPIRPDCVVERAGEVKGIENEFCEEFGDGSLVCCLDNEELECEYHEDESVPDGYYVTCEGYDIEMDEEPVADDADMDGVPDEYDICPGVDDKELISSIVPGASYEEALDVIAEQPPSDYDADKIPDFCDFCPMTASFAVNSPEADCDQDGVPNVEDMWGDIDNRQDADKDGVPDGIDLCPYVPATNTTTIEGNVIEVESDADEDGVGDACDNCPNFFNPNQEDMDSNGIGDFCDPNSLDFVAEDCRDEEDCDGDGVVFAEDRCFPGDDYFDDDNDGVPDECDNCPTVANFDQYDSDGNGFGDACPEFEAEYSDKYAAQQMAEALAGEGGEGMEAGEGSAGGCGRVTLGGSSGGGDAGYDEGYGEEDYYGDEYYEDEYYDEGAYYDEAGGEYYDEGGADEGGPEGGGGGGYAGLPCEEFGISGSDCVAADESGNQVVCCENGVLRDDCMPHPELGVCCGNECQ